MAPSRITGEKGIGKNSCNKTWRKKISKKRPAQQGGVNQPLVVPQFFKFPKFMRLFSLREMLFLRRRKSKWEQQQEEVELFSEEEACSATCFWRDPDTEFCNICGDDKGNHLELMCPYNYLSPGAAARSLGQLHNHPPLRYKCWRHREVEFLRCLVRVNNLPELCPLEQLVELFGRFGPLRMWYVATQGSGTCKGYGCVVFQHHRHAEEAVEALNCWEFGGRKLRVDWAYPCLNC
uniref:RRM domain-containing protein n=1 Tax=Oryza punctata TaxID=4537 RepID=A0A0E0L0N2_ORYPU